MRVPTTIAEFQQLYPDSERDWVQITGSSRFDYPIDYAVAVLHVDADAGRIDFLSRWAPQNYCHYHRHLGETSVLVLQGEHNVVEDGATETVHRWRRPGFFTTNPGGDVHMEHGGPEGSLVYFSCKAVDGKLFEVLDRNGEVLTTATIDDFTSGAVAGGRSAGATAG